MSETSSPSLEIAFQVIDSITRVKGVIGAMLVDTKGEVVAQDFQSQDDRERCWPIGKGLGTELAGHVAPLNMGAILSMQVQVSNMTVRMLRIDPVWLAVFGKEDLNLGMLNVEIRNRSEQIRSLLGSSIIEARDSERDRLLSTLRTERSLDRLIEERSADIGALRALHGMLFQAALGAGVQRETISRRINDINYRLYRDSLLDIGFDFFNRKALDNYDPSLARKVMREQIRGLAEMILERL